MAILQDKFIREDGSVIGSDIILSCKYTSDVNSQTNLTVGDTTADKVEVEILTPEKPIAAGEKLQYIQIEDSVEHRIGLFYAETPTAISSRAVRFVAYDGMAALSADFSNWLNNNQEKFPMTVRELVQYACSVAGVPISDDDHSTLDVPVQAFYAKGVTCRQIVGWAAQLCGAFAACNASGDIQFSWYRQSDITFFSKSNWQTVIYEDILYLTSDAGNAEISNDVAVITGGAVMDNSGTITDGRSLYYFLDSFSKRDYSTDVIKRVQIKQGTDDVGVIYPAGESGNVFTLNQNGLAAQLDAETLNMAAAQLYDKLCNITYTPLSFKSKRTSLIKAGDIISVVDADGKKHTTYVMQVYTDSGGTTITSTGDKNYSDKAAVSSEKYQNIPGKMLTLTKDIDGLRVENKDTAGKLATLELTVDGISTTVQTQGDKIGTLESSIEQTDSKIDMRVSEITVGGRNLFRGTGTEITNDAYLAAQYAPAGEPLIPGEVYTFSICVTPGENVYAILLHFSYGYALAAAVVPDGTGKQTLSKTFRMQYADGRYPEDAAINGYAVIFCATRQNTGETDQPIERGDTTIHWVKIEKGNKATDWSPAPEDVDGEIAGVSERTASLSITVDSISSRVSNQETVNGTLQKDMTAIQQTAENLNISVQSIRDDGVSKVTTEKGFTFDDQGLTIKQSGSEMENLLNETGMYVTRSGETILQANNEGVVATDVSVRNYLIIGSHARFEDYESGRTACFWI